MAQVIHDMPFAEYAAAPGLNASTLKAFRRSAAHGAATVTAADEPSDSMLLGRILHSAIESGLEAALSGAVEVPGKTTAHKSYREAVDGGADVVLCDGWRERVEGMYSSINRHPHASKILRFKPQSEVSMFWDDPDLGVRCKMRADWLVTGVGVVDVKSAASVDPLEMSKAVERYGYHMQAAWYSRGFMQVFGLDHCAFRFVFTESTAPYVTVVVDLDDEAMNQGWAECWSAAQRWKRWRQTGEAPGFADDRVLTVGLPRWAVIEGWQAPVPLRGGE